MADLDLLITKYIDRVFDVLSPVVDPFQPLVDQAALFSYNCDVALAEFLSSNGLPVPVDQFKYILCMVAIIFISWIFKTVSPFLPNFLKHLISIVLSLSICGFCLGRYAWFHSFITAFVTYLACLILPRKHVGTVVMIWAMTYLSLSHIYRMYTSYLSWNLDFTGPQMLVTQKISSFACNYTDGASPIPDPSDKTPRLIEELNKHKRHYKIERLPNPISYFGFIYFFPSFLAGPSIEYKDYEEFMNTDSRTIPAGVVPTILTFLKALASLVPTVLYMTVLNVSYVETPEYYALPLYLRIWWAHWCTAFSRWRYYFGWYLAEVSFVVIGYSYKKDKQGNVTWSRATNAYPLKCEFCQNCKDITDNWNLCTANWLKNYVYLRLTPPNGNQTTVATVGTYFVSAFWHGFYPGYYLFFVLTGFMTEIARDARRRIRPYFVTGVGKDEKPKQPIKFLYDVFTYFTTTVFVGFGGTPFLLLSWEKSIQFWSSVYYYALFPTLVLFLYFKFVPARSPRHTTVVKKAQ